MSVVSDTTTLISFFSIGNLVLLGKYLGKVLIPQAVFDAYCP